MNSPTGSFQRCCGLGRKLGSFFGFIPRARAISTCRALRRQIFFAFLHTSYGRPFVAMLPTSHLPIGGVLGASPPDGPEQKNCCQWLKVDQFNSVGNAAQMWVMSQFEIRVSTLSGPVESAQSVGGVARLSRNVRQPDYIPANAVAGHEAEPRPGAGEERLALTKDRGRGVE